MSAVSLADLSWFIGRWHATIADATCDCPAPNQELSSELSMLSPESGLCIGVWRLGSDGASLIRIAEVNGTLEWTQAEFDAALTPRGAPVRFSLRQVSPNEAVFESVGATGHSRIERMRMVFSLTSPEVLVISFLIPGEGNSWVAVREEPHTRAG